MNYYKETFTLFNTKKNQESKSLKSSAFRGKKRRPWRSTLWVGEAHCKLGMPVFFAPAVSGRAGMRLHNPIICWVLHLAFPMMTYIYQKHSLWTHTTVAVPTGFQRSMAALSEKDSTNYPTDIYLKNVGLYVHATMCCVLSQHAVKTAFVFLTLVSR